MKSSDATLFLTLQDVLEIHEELISVYGGESGVRDLALLRSAIEMPRAGHADGFLHESLFDMAAAYLFHLVQNHPFVDGNKRTGAATAIIFLTLNGVRIRNDENGLVDTTLSVIEGTLSKSDVSVFFESISKR